MNAVLYACKTLKPEVSASYVVPNKPLEPKTRCLMLIAFIGNRGPAVSLPETISLLLFLKLFAKKHTSLLVKQ